MLQDQFPVFATVAVWITAMRKTHPGTSIGLFRSTVSGPIQVLLASPSFLSFPVSTRGSSYPYSPSILTTFSEPAKEVGHPNRVLLFFPSCAQHTPAYRSNPCREIA